MSLTACGDLQHDSPFDPQTPPDQQARTSLAGTVSLEPVGGVVPGAAGIQVSVAGHGYSSTTDASGSYVIDGVPPGSYTVQAVLADYETTAVAGVTATLDTGGGTVTVPTLAMRRVRADLVGTVDLKLPDNSLEATGGASVSVAGAGGGAAPVAALFQRAALSGALTSGSAGAALTDPAGGFVIQNVPAPIGSYTLTASKLGYVTQTSTVTFQNGAFVVQTVQLVIDPGDVHGTVVVGGAATSAGVTVRARGTTLGGTPWEEVTLSAADGSYRISGLPAGNYTVSYELTDYATVSTGASVAPGTFTLLADAVLVHDTGSLTGTFTLAGAPSSAGIVVTAASGAMSASALTDPSGGFSFPALETGSWVVSARKDPDWIPSGQVTANVSRNVPALLGAVPLTPITTASLAGAALLELQSDASGTTVTLTGTDFRGVAVAAGTTTATASDGSWSFGALRAGSYQVAFSHALFDAPALIGLSLVTGQAGNVGSLTLAASRGSVGGTVTAAGAASHAGTVVEIAGGPDAATAVTDAAGAWRVTGLRVGSGYTATYRRTGYTTPAPSGFSVLSAATTTVAATDLALATTGSITGVATVARPAGGAASAGILVSLTGTDLNGASVTGSTSTVAGGSFTLSTLPQGTYALAYSKLYYDGQARSGIAVVAGGTATAPSVTLAVSTGTIAGQAILSRGVATAFAQGTDYSGIVVTLTGLDAGVSVGAAVTDAAGNFRFDGAPVSTAGAAYGVVAQSANYSSASGSVTAVGNGTAAVSPSPLTLAVNAGSVSATVAVNDTGTPTAPASGTVTLSLTGSAFNSTSFSANANNTGGAVSLANVPAGTYEVVATSASRACGSPVTVTVSPGATTTIAAAYTCTDAIAPGVPILGLALNSTGGVAGYVTSTTATVPVTTGAADGTSNFRGYQWVLGATPSWSSATTVAAPASTPVSLAVTGLTLDAANTVWVRALDLVGNAGTAVSTTVIADGAAPAMATILTPRLWVNDTTTSVTVSGGADANFDHYEKCSFDFSPTSTCPACACGATGSCSCGSGVDTCSFATTDASFALPIGSVAGKEKSCVYARAVDKAGRAGALASREIVSDLVPPTGPGISPLFDPTTVTFHADYVDFFVTSPATDSPGGGAAWANVAWVEVNTGSGFSPLCPAVACHPGGVYDPCNATCACTDARLVCREGAFYGVRVPLLGGVANSVAVRAVDIAGNVGSGASQSVNVSGVNFQLSATAYAEAQPRARGQLLVYLGAPSTTGKNVTRLVDLGANQLFDWYDTSCEIASVASTAAGVSTEPHAEPLSGTAVVFSEVPSVSNQLRVRRAGADKAFCTGDDTTTLLKSYASAYPSFDSVSASMSASGARERAAYAEIPSSGNATVYVRDGGASDGTLGAGVDDVEYTVATAGGTYVHQLELAGDALVFGASAAPYTVACSNLRVFQASGGSFASGVAATWTLPAAARFAALDDGGKALAYYALETGLPTLHVINPGADGRYGTADDDDRKVSWSGPNVTDGGLTFRGGHVVLVEGGVASGAYYIDHWYAGGDGIFGSGDDTFARILPSASPRFHPSLGAGVSGGMLYFEVGALNAYGDVLGVDLSAFRWDVAGAAAPLAGPVTSHAGNLLYTDSGGKLRSRTSDGSETTLTGIAPSTNYGASGALAFVTSGTQIWAYREGPASGQFFAPDSPAATLVGTLPAAAYVYAAGDGRAIARESSTGTFNLYEPNGALTSWTAVTMTGVPAGYSFWFGGQAVSAFQAVTGCISGSPNFYKQVCVREAGADGIFGTGDDRLFTLTRPGGGNYSNLVAVATSGHRVALIADGVGGPHLYVLDAGPLGRLSLDGDDVEVDYGLVADGRTGAIDIAGDMVAWITDNGANGQQVFLADFVQRTQRTVTSHFSAKSNVVVDASGRVAWSDTVFAAGGIFVDAP